MTEEKPGAIMSVKMKMDQEQSKDEYTVEVWR